MVQNLVGRRDRFLSFRKPDFSGTTSESFKIFPIEETYFAVYSTNGIR
jgi:hypothetical protein